MRTIVLLLAACPILLVPGVAAADSDTYAVSRSWELTYVHGDPRIVPDVEDDVVEVTCHNEDQMKDWWVNDEDLVDEARERADGTGVQVQPEFTGETETLKITIACEKA
ncbi:hypothetical protein FHX44_111422 [Pseudonocardia hierapolitana]|uniref:Ig-like domain-containing protein n=1 Tax=Pseudonocardia hierapolitana TaxID=1128676 RepID=A0A561SKZ8_9PSEU|nr:hypothetical protein [Pseudonocardia hierapolitana]TWF75538.1 hypothetical protein FHX44_111422 [Pseudonocardia hierapolitana]